MLQLRSEMARRKGAWEAFSCVVEEHTDAGGKKKKESVVTYRWGIKRPSQSGSSAKSGVYLSSKLTWPVKVNDPFPLYGSAEIRRKKEDDEASTSFLFLWPVANAAGLPEGVVARRHKWPGFSSPGHFPGRHVTILSILAVSPPILFFFCFFLCRVSQQQSKSFRLTRNFAYKRPLISAGNYFLPLNGYSALSFTGRRARDREFQQLPLPFLFSLCTQYFIQNFVSIRKISNWLCAISEMGNWWLSFPSGRRIWARSHSPISNSDLFEWFRLKQQITQSI